TVCRILPSSPNTTSAPSGAAVLFVPRIRLREVSVGCTQIAGSSASVETESVATIARIETGASAGAEPRAETVQRPRSKRRVCMVCFLPGARHPWVAGRNGFRSIVGRRSPGADVSALAPIPCRREYPVLVHARVVVPIAGPAPLGMALDVGDVQAAAMV